MYNNAVSLLTSMQRLWSVIFTVPLTKVRELVKFHYGIGSVNDNSMKESRCILKNGKFFQNSCSIHYTLPPRFKNNNIFLSGPWKRTSTYFAIEVLNNSIYWEITFSFKIIN